MKFSDSFPTYPSISERDINLILVEELIASEGFQSRLFQSSGIFLLPRGNARGVLAFTEVCLPGEFSAEIDVIAVAETTTTTDARSVYLLIENKIDVGFQPLQPERYSGQAKTLVAGGHVDVAKTILVAPRDYIMSSSAGIEAFDVKVSYEEVQSWLASDAESKDELMRRAAVKRSLLQQAIQKQKRLMPKLISPMVTLSWAQIYSIASRDFPDLKMAAPGDKGRSSWSIDLPCIARRAPLLLARLEYVLKKGDHIPQPGTVSVLLPNLGDKIDAARTALSQILPPGAAVRKAGGSLGISIYVPHLEPNDPFESQIEKLTHGLESARVLRDWFERNFAELASFAEMVT